ncbi:MAG: methyltransferase [Candidatus Competibacteraceae bacterium]|nr:methyltransferase [Candidatus Competibacteraceae bacterium]
MPGDIVEAGVFRGRSILATAMVLRELNSDKVVYGYDTFTGFPPVYHDKDDIRHFESLAAAGKISSDHLAATKLLLTHRKALSRTTTAPDALSQSGRFDDAPLELLKDKIRYLGLDKWIRLVPGDFALSMGRGDGPRLVMAALLDCDLYASYMVALPWIWPNLVRGGYLWLDEYFSLKFPGARIACDEFFADKADKPTMHLRQPRDFERWYVQKFASD